jgi:hypothetical protein
MRVVASVYAFSRPVQVSGTEHYSARTYACLRICYPLRLGTLVCPISHPLRCRLSPLKLTMPNFTAACVPRVPTRCTYTGSSAKALPRRFPLLKVSSLRGCDDEQRALPSASPKVTREPSRRSVIDNLRGFLIGVSALLVAEKAKAAQGNGSDKQKDR